MKMFERDLSAHYNTPLLYSQRASRATQSGAGMQTVTYREVLERFWQDPAQIKH